VVPDPDITFHFDADPDPAFHFDADPDLAFHFHKDPKPASQNYADPDPQHWLYLPIFLLTAIWLKVTISAGTTANYFKYRIFSIFNTVSWHLGAFSAGHLVN
jgi:hypothetical protein